MQSGAKKCQRIAILGGSFDPPTISHLQVSFSFLYASLLCLILYHFFTLWLIQLFTKNKSLYAITFLVI